MRGRGRAWAGWACAACLASAAPGTALAATGSGSAPALDSSARDSAVAPAESTGAVAETPVPRGRDIPRRKSRYPELYGLAGVIPGLGHLFLGEPLRGGAYFGAFFAPTVALDLAFPRAVPRGDSAKLMTAGYITQDLWFYNMYDAYHEAAGGARPSPWADYAGCFDARYLADWRVSLPLAFPAALLFLADIPAGDRDPALHNRVWGRRFGGRAPAWAAADGALSGTFAFTGWGEEALFRGFLQQSLVERAGPWVGIPLASVLFGLAHFNAQQGYGIAQTLLGLHLGYLAQANHYDLRESMFLHSWWDILLLLYAWKGDQRGGVVNLTLPPIHF